MCTCLAGYPSDDQAGDLVRRPTPFPQESCSAGDGMPADRVTSAGGSRMRRAVVGLLGALGLAGCAALQTGDVASAERVLTAAGFQARPADTPEKLAHLESLPPRKVLLQPQNGERRYVYADPTSCKCLYVGGEEQY